MIFEIALGMGVFTFVVLSLVVILTVLEKNLIPQGEVKLLINKDEEKSPMVSPGSTLLTALGSNGVFLPSACGGGGTCAMCLCQVTDGGGDILPTELTHISRKDAREDWRLACQVKIKGPMEIQIPEEIFNIQKFNTTVKSNDNVATFIKELILEIDDGQSLNFEAGGYIQIDVPVYQNLSYESFDIQEEYRGDWDKFNLWKYVANNDEEITRAYSMANHPAEGNRVMLNVRIASPPPGRDDLPPGICSSYIFNMKPGDKVVVSGPYGEFFQKKTDREMCFIGGGAGMAPMRSHIFDLFHTQRTTRKATFWYGARALREMFYQDDFNKISDEFENFNWTVALSDPVPEDNWTGSVGFIHQVALDEYLGTHEDPTEIEYYLCGPPMMLSAVTKMLEDLGVEKEMIMYDEF